MNPGVAGADGGGLPSARVLLVLLLVFAAMWFGSLDHRKLIASDEGRYAEIGREMAVSGDWVTPRYNGVKYFEKPVLLYWATAAAFTLFGETEWAARLWVGLCGFAGVLLLYFTGAALFGRTAGLLAAAVLGSSVLWVGGGHITTTDMGVSFFLECALCALLLAQRAGLAAQAARRCMLVCWAAMALAVLSKGLIGIVLPGMVLAGYLAVTRDWRLLSRLHIGKGLCVFLIVAAPWFVWVSVRNPEFAHFFFIHEHFGRFTEIEGYNRRGGWWYFIVILGIGMLPWLAALPGAFSLGALRAEAKHPAAALLRPRLLLLLWVVLIFLFFSVSRSKLPGYILPVVPAIALLAGIALADMQRKGLLIVLGSAFLLMLCALYGSGHVSRFAPNPQMLGAYAVYESWVRSAVIAMLAGTILAFVWVWSSTSVNAGRAGALLLFAFAGHAGIQAIFLGHESLRENSSAYDVAQKVNRVIDRTQPFYSVKLFDHTLPFYIKKTMTLVAHRDELAFGLEQEPGLWVPTVAEFEKRWAADKKPMALMTEATFAQLQAGGLPMRMVARDARRVIVAKP